MKKLISLLLSLVLTIGLVGCSSSSSSSSSDSDSSEAKIGIILVGDENEGYTEAHIEGIKAAAEKLGISDDQIVWKYSIGEDQTCHDAAVDLVEAGCTLVISNSYGHQTFMEQAASEYSDVTFISDTGDTAALSGLDNFKNAFTGIYEARYVSGIVAGMKIAELDAAGELTDDNKTADGKVKVGYVGAKPYAEVISGYTAFYLGIQSVYPDVEMEVVYTNSWFDLTAEGEAANNLISQGCVIIGQHADSTGAPSACQAALEAGTTVYSVGYNVDMLSVAPDAALTSATNNWAVFYEYAFNCWLNGTEIDTDWCEGYTSDAVGITALGESCAEGTQDKVDEAVAAIKDGSLHVFDVSTFTVDGAHPDEIKIDLTGDFDTDDEEDINAVSDGYFHESEYRSAPSFNVIIDGINVNE